MLKRTNLFLVFSMSVMIMGCTSPKEVFIEKVRSRKIPTHDEIYTYGESSLKELKKELLEHDNWIALNALAMIPHKEAIVIIAEWYFTTKSLSGEMLGFAADYLENIVTIVNNKQFKNFEDFKAWYETHHEDVVWDEARHRFRYPLFIEKVRAGIMPTAEEIRLYGVPWMDELRTELFTHDNEVALQVLTKIPYYKQVVEMIAEWYLTTTTSSEEITGFAAAYLETVVDIHLFTTVDEFEVWFNTHHEHIVWEEERRRFIYQEEKPPVKIFIPSGE